MLHIESKTLVIVIDFMTDAHQPHCGRLVWHAGRRMGEFFPDEPQQWRRLFAARCGAWVCCLSPSHPHKRSDHCKKKKKKAGVGGELKRVAPGEPRSPGLALAITQEICFVRRGRTAVLQGVS